MKWSQLAEGERTLLKVSGSLFVVAALVWVGVIFLPFLSVKPVDEGSRVIYATPTSEEREASLAKVALMRSKMEVWARRNKEAISRMRNGDKGAFDTVYAAVPAYPKEQIIGFNSQDAQMYAWCCHVGEAVKELGIVMNPTNEKNLSKSKRIEKTLVTNSKQKTNDLPIVRSMLPGRKKYVLWASGRVTENDISDGCTTATDCIATETQKQVLPPYQL